MSGNSSHQVKGSWDNLKVCPKCGKEYRGYPALSRRDNKTEICPDCGQKEALDDYRGYLEIKH